jgi:hypothetical protein
MSVSHGSSNQESADCAPSFRQIQIWMAGTRSPAFAAECRQQSLLVANDPAEAALMDQLEALQDLGDDWLP